MTRWRCVLVALLCAISAVGCNPASDSDDSGTGSGLSERLGGEDADGFARALQPREFRFPVDHGPHPDYRTEWWYLTGNLETPAGRHFGYQVTFFRIALAPPDPPAEARRSGWATRQVWMAHAALSDAAERRHRERERFARGAAGLAGAHAEPFRVWLEDWQLRGRTGTLSGVWELEADTEEFALHLELEPLKPIVLQGDAGLSRKSAEPGNASYYYSIPRLRTSGTIRAGDEEFPVTGLSWLDREWSTSALAENQVGWDWFALQFEDGRDLMFYRLRRSDETADPLSAGTLVSPDGDVRRLGAKDVSLEVLRRWRSSDGAAYPVAWRLGLADGSSFRVEAVFDDQRMETAVAYWEGMVVALDALSGEPRGRGYLELAGYE